jgi:hypothetical protein
MCPVGAPSLPSSYRRVIAAEAGSELLWGPSASGLWLTQRHRRWSRVA